MRHSAQMEIGQVGDLYVMLCLIRFAILCGTVRSNKV
jgi:hypothetical protein